jgi:hypothetical protein
MAFLLFVLAFPNCVIAQSPATPARGNKSDASTQQDFSQEPSVYEYIHAAMRYENDGSGSREVRARLRVKHRQG